MLSQSTSNCKPKQTKPLNNSKTDDLNVPFFPFTILTVLMEVQRANPFDTGKAFFLGQKEGFQTNW